MCVRGWHVGGAVLWALGVNRLILVPGYAAAWSMWSLSTSRALFSAFASAPWIMVSTCFAVFWGYLPAKDFTSPFRCPAFLLYLVNGTAFFLSITSLRYCLALVNVMPFIALHTSRACLWDTLTSRPEAFAVFSGSSVSGIIEYPHFGMFYFSDCAINSVKAIYMAFRKKTSSTTKWTSLAPFWRTEFRAVRCT